jgi:hypothetical protein
MIVINNNDSKKDNRQQQQYIYMFAVYALSRQTVPFLPYDPYLQKPNARFLLWAKDNHFSDFGGEGIEKREDGTAWFAGYINGCCVLFNLLMGKESSSQFIYLSQTTYCIIDPLLTVLFPVYHSLPTHPIPPQGLHFTPPHLLPQLLIGHSLTRCVL